MAGGFSNPIVGGGGALVYPSIHSPNFNVANPSASPNPSWAVLKNGLAYFFGLVLAGGTITGPDYIINTSGIFIYSGTPAHGNMIGSWAGTSGTDGFSNTYQAGFGISQGAISGTTFSGTDFTITTAGAFFYSGVPAAGNLAISIVPGSASVPDGLGNTALAGITSYPSLAGNPSVNLSDGEIVFDNPAGFGPGLVTAQGTGTLSLESPTSTVGDAAAAILLQSSLESYSGSVPEVVMTALVQAAPGKAPIVSSDPNNPPGPETWHVPSLGGGWSGAAGLTIQYTLMPTGLVCIAGRLIAGTVVAGTTIFTLPFGYNPLHGTISVQCRNVTTNGTVNFTVNTTGVVQYQSGMVTGNVVDMDAVFPVSMTN